MARGRRGETWDHTATLAAEIHNGSLRTAQPLQPADWHPFLKPDRKPDPKAPAMTITDPRDLATLFGQPLQIVR